MWSALKQVFKSERRPQPSERYVTPVVRPTPLPMVSAQQQRSSSTGNLIAELSRSNTMLIKVVHDYQQLLSVMCGEAFRAHHFIEDEMQAMAQTPPNSTNTLVYVLQLQQHKYYVGKTKRLLARFQQHERGEGATWTRKYKPVRIVATYPCLVPNMENAVVKLYMSKKGIPNVRGGSYSNEDLSVEQLRCLELELTHDADRCFKCNKTGHYARECPGGDTALPPALPPLPLRAKAEIKEDKEEEELYFFK